MDTNNTDIEERILKRIPFEILGIAVILSVPVLFFFNISSALLFIAGGVLSALSFIWLKQAVSRFLLKDKRKALSSAVFIYILRLILIIAVFFIIIFFFSKMILAFVAGFSTLILVFFIEAAGALIKLKQWKN